MKSRDKDSLQKEIENLNNQIAGLNSKCDELTCARSDLTKDLASLRIDYTDQVREYARQVDDNVSAKHNLEQVIGHLREEVYTYCDHCSAVSLTWNFSFISEFT